MLDDPEARCLDGTQGAYYLGRGVGSGINKWLIFGEGKAWCLSAQDCLARTKAPDGRGGWMASAGAALRAMHSLCRAAFWDLCHALSLSLGSCSGSQRLR